MKHTKSHKVRPGQRLIMGKNCLWEVLNSQPEQLKKIFCLRRKGQDPLAELAKKRSVSLDYLDRDALTNLVESDSHQGYVALIKEQKPVTLDDYLGKERTVDLVIALDSVQDPQNLGAILRASECFGAGTVVWSKNRGVGLTPTVSKVSVGASELVRPPIVSNLAEAIKKFKRAGYTIYSAEIAKSATALKDIAADPLSLIIFGSEGEGVRPLLSKQADYQVYIPMSGQIDSLNVSQSVAVFLSAFSKND